MYVYYADFLEFWKESEPHCSRFVWWLDSYTIFQHSENLNTVAMNQNCKIEYLEMIYCLPQCLNTKCKLIYTENIYFRLYHW